MSLRKRNEIFELSNGSYSVSDAQNCFEYTQNCFEYIIKEHEARTDNPRIKIFVYKIENRITFGTKTVNNWNF